jgi:diguanylate cyclase (GGDEF)-like protein
MKICKMSFIKENLSKRFSLKLPVAVRIYYIHAIAAVFFAVWVFVANYNITERLGHILPVGFICFAFILFNIYIFIRPYKYTYLFISDMMIIFGAFPSIYYASSGIYGGGLLLFLLGIALFASIVKRPYSYYMGVLLLVWYSICVAFSIVNPDLVYDLGDKAFSNMVFTFAIATVILFVLLTFLVAGYNREHTQLKILNDKLNIELITDDMTDIYNHRYIKNEVIRAISQATPTSKIYLCMYDIDDFKLVNDEFGHVAGNDVLYAFAQMMKREIGSHGICARFGGEEFLVLFENKTREQVYELAEKIRIKASQEIMIPGSTKRITVSCGIVQYKMGENAEIFVKSVDDSMYKAKHKGKNQTVFY